MQHWGTNYRSTVNLREEGKSIESVLISNLDLVQLIVRIKIFFKLINGKIR